MDNSLYPSIFEGILRLHRKVRFLASSLELSLGATESHILVAVSEESGIGPTSLVPVLNLDRSTISRTILALQQEGLLALTSSAVDKRSRNISLTPKGEQRFAEWETQMYRLTEALVSSLNRAEQQILTGYLRRLADSQRAAAIGRTGLHPVQRELMRISRASGILGRTFLHTGRSLSEVQVLSVLWQEKEPVIFTAIAGQLPFDKSTLSRVLTKLTSKGEIERNEVPEDRRSVSFALTADGIRSHEGVMESGARSIGTSLTGFSLKELQEFNSLLERCAPIDAQSVDFRKLNREMEVRQLFQESERNVARGFYVENQVRLGEHFSLPEKLFCQDGLSYGCFIDSRLQGVCDFQKAGHRWVLRIFFVNRPIVDDAIHVKFLQEVLTQAAARLKQDSLEIGPGILSDAQRQVISGSLRGFLTLVHSAA